MHPTDEAELKRMLGEIVLPQVVIDAYTKRRELRDLSLNGGGAMHIDTLVEIILETGGRPNAEAMQQRRNDTVKQIQPNTTVMVNWHGEWKTATFIERGRMGEMIIEFPGNPMRQAIEPFNVKPYTLPDDIAEEVHAHVEAFHNGEWISGRVHHTHGTERYAVTLEGDEKAYRIFHRDQLRFPDMAVV